MAKERPTVVIVGAGFAGLAAVRELDGADARVILIDRRNHHTFQPLLYQVATAALSPADIAAPIRSIVAKQRNCEVVLGEVRAIDADRRAITVNGREIVYDRLVLATGATHSYFGNDDWVPHAPGLKTIEDAVEIRRRVLMAFETAEMAEDEDARRAALTFIVVGAGPTGVEMAGALAEIALKVVRGDYHRIDTASARVILLEAQDRVLAAMDEECSRKALDQLRELGVSVWLGRSVTSIDGEGVWLGEERVNARTVVWAAGVKASPLGKMLGVETDRRGRVTVDAFLHPDGRPEVSVVGDLAQRVEDDGDEVPGVAPAAIQMGRYAGRSISEALRTGSAPTEAFKYRDKGLLATIGRHRATGQVFGRHVHGFVAWVMWAGVHLFFLIGFRNRFIVMMEWLWNYVTFRRGARLITGDLAPPRLATESAPTAEHAGV
ncbi:MAG: FAD-dependent oxidoreductase [Phycisphaerae bacterium]|nr:FAD-dependent oxidoreductase [Phycisphaerae bacterium]